MATLDSGTLLDGRYLLGEARASGATATVWAADDQFLRRRVAIKILHTHLVEDADLLSRFRDEARVAATVSHPNLVAVYDSIHDHPGIVLEWIEGPDLRHRLDETSLTPGQIAAIGVDLCAGLQALHDHGLVHRDVKPANILLTPAGATKLTDFGIATANPGDRTATGVVLGTAKYLAPEQVQGADLDGRTDVFALAAVLYEALAGRPPWVRDGDLPTAIARLEEDPADLARLRPDVPGELAGAVMRGLARDPGERWPSAAAFASGMLGGSRLPPPPAPPVMNEDATATAALVVDPRAPADPRPRSDARPSEPGSRTEPSTRARRPRRRRWPRVLGGVAVLAIAALGWALISPGNDDPLPPTAPGAVDVRSVQAFDPEGTGPPGEHDDRAADALDGDRSTSWPTEHYESRTFGAKSGVGLIIRLTEPSPLREIEIRTLSSSDWSAQIRVATDVAEDVVSVDAFGPVEATATGLDTIAVIPLATGGDTVLVWITDLGAGPLPLRMNVAEVTIR